MLFEGGRPRGEPVLGVLFEPFGGESAAVVAAVVAAAEAGGDNRDHRVLRGGPRVRVVVLAGPRPSPGLAAGRSGDEGQNRAARPDRVELCAEL